MPDSPQSDVLNPELEQARAAISRARQKVATSVAALREEVLRRAQWREWIRKRPWEAVIGAFAIGFWLGRRR